MLETLNQPNSTDPKVADNPNVVDGFSEVVKGRLGIHAADIQTSNTLKVVQSVSTAMKKATEAIQENSAVLSNVISKEQKNMFANFFKQLRMDTREGEQSFAKNQEKFLGKIAALQVSLSESVARTPEDRNLIVLLRAVEEIKSAFVPESKSNLWREIKAQLFTPLRREHFKEDSFIRRAFFNGADVYGQKLQRAQNVQKVHNALEPIEGPLGLYYDAEKNKYTPSKDPFSTFKPGGKNFRAASGMAQPPMPPNTVKAAGFEPNKKILEESVAALVALGKHDKKKARDEAIEAMKKGASSVQEVLKQVLAEGNLPVAPAPITPVVANAEPVVAELATNSRVQYNDLREVEESPYADTDPNALPPHYEDLLAYLPALQKKQLGQKPKRRARQLGAKRGGLAGPDLFNVVHPEPELSMESGRNIGDVLQTPEIGENSPEKAEIVTPLIQKEENKVEKQLETANDTLEEISASLQTLVQQEGGLGSIVSNPVAAGAGAAVKAGGVAAPLMVGMGGLAGGFLLGEGVNKLTGQETATHAIMESRRLNRIDQDNIQANQNVARSRGYDSFAEWHKANMARAKTMNANELIRANNAATPVPSAAAPAAPIVIQQPAPAASPIIEPTMSGGVRPTDPTFLRFQDKRWTRSA